MSFEPPAVHPSVSDQAIAFTSTNARGLKNETVPQAQREVLAEKETAVAAAQAAEEQLRKQMSSSATSSTALREAQAEAESLSQQLEESARKYNTVKQARERAMSEVSLR